MSATQTFKYELNYLLQDILASTKVSQAAFCYSAIKARDYAYENMAVITNTDSYFTAAVTPSQTIVYNMSGPPIWMQMQTQMPEDFGCAGMETNTLNSNSNEAINRLLCHIGLTPVLNPNINSDVLSVPAERAVHGVQQATSASYLRGLSGIARTNENEMIGQLLRGMGMSPILTSNYGDLLSAPANDADVVAPLDLKRITADLTMTTLEIDVANKVLDELNGDTDLESLSVASNTSNYEHNHSISLAGQEITTNNTTNSVKQDIYQILRYLCIPPEPVHPRHFGSGLHPIAFTSSRTRNSDRVVARPRTSTHFVANEPSPLVASNFDLLSTPTSNTNTRVSDATPNATHMDLGVVEDDIRTPRSSTRGPCFIPSAIIGSDLRVPSPTFMPSPRDSEPAFPDRKPSPGDVMRWTPSLLFQPDIVSEVEMQPISRDWDTGAILLDEVDFMQSAIYPPRSFTPPVAEVPEDDRGRPMPNLRILSFFVSPTVQVTSCTCSSFHFRAMNM
jgi:hypothetical protein